MTLRLSLAAALVALVFTPTRAAANVSLRNGNFFIGYSDLSYSGGFLVANGDGTVTVYENGGGAHNDFAVIGHPTDAEVAAEVERIVAAEKKPVGEVSAYRSHLRTDAYFRHDERHRLAKAKRVRAPDAPLGSLFVSEKFGHRVLSRTARGYERDYDGNHEVFAADGSLERITDKNSNYVDLARDSRGRLRSIRDNLGRTISLAYSPDGFVTRAAGADGAKWVVYRYDNRGNLVFSRDSAGDVYAYDYDARHDPVKITYADRTTLEVAYHAYDPEAARSGEERVRLVKDRDGTKTLHSTNFDADPSVGQIVSVEEVAPDGEVRSSSLYEYVFGIRNDGTRYDARITSVIDGDRTVTEYDPLCNTPLRIERSGGVALFRYDSHCHVTLKDTPRATVTLAYDAAAGKVSRVETVSKDDSKRQFWATYAHDAKGNLSSAVGSDGHAATVQYDANGRITTLAVGARQRTILHFKYDRNGKQIEIAVDGLGTLETTYGATGEIAKVVGDRRVSLAVTAAFQSLLDLTRPAEVRLSF